MTRDDKRGTRLRSLESAILAPIAMLLALGVTACESFLDVRETTRVDATTLDDPAQSQLLVNSAIADFECAFANYVTATGLLTDELIIATEFIAPTSWDLRRITPDNQNLGSGGCTAFGFGLWTPLQTARFQAEQAFEKIQEFPDAEVPGNKTQLLATAAAYAGYSLTLIGEGFCEATVDVGPLLQPADVLRLAEDRFSQSIDLAQQVGDDEILNMARVGRARVRLDLGDLSGAVSDASAVPEGFVKNATYDGSTERRENTVFVYNRRLIMVSVDPRFRALEVEGIPDPRVSVTDANRLGQDGLTALWFQDLFPTVDSPIAIASWDEAQLIIAEAEGGQAAVDAINRLRRNESIPEFQSTDPAEIQAQVIEERRRELYLQSHRLNDMLRFDLPFDTGVNHKGQPFSDTSCLPLPDTERKNNPNL